MQENIIYGFELGLMLIIVPAFGAWIINKLFHFFKSMLLNK